MFSDASRMTTDRSSRAQFKRPDDAMANEQVARHVRDLIVRGQFGPGQRLPTERELVREIGVSRTSVRAGLQALAAKGLLVIRHGSGSFVADGPPMLDSEPLSLLAALHGFTRTQIFEARRTLEVSIARMAAERRGAEQLLAISDAVSGMFSACEDPQAFLVEDIRFHGVGRGRLRQSHPCLRGRDDLGDVLRATPPDRRSPPRSSSGGRHALAHLSSNPRSRARPGGAPDG